MDRTTLYQKTCLEFLLMIGDFMLKKICYKTKNLLSLIPNYELKSIKTHYYNEDGDYDKEEFYLVNNNYKIKRITTTCSPFCFGPTVYFEDNSCVELFYENVNSEDDTLIRVHNNSIISPKLISSEGYIEATAPLIKWLKNLSVSEDSLNKINEEFDVYRTIEYFGVPNVYVDEKNRVWNTSENLVLNEKDINIVLDGIEDKNLRAKIKQILYARVFKTRY